ncbi:hypothetical protein ACEPAI_2772 [Sanghuangporus weigelae]
MRVLTALHIDLALNSQIARHELDSIHTRLARIHAGFDSLHGRKRVLSTMSFRRVQPNLLRGETHARSCLLRGTGKDDVRSDQLPL